MLQGVFGPTNFFRLNRHQHLITNIEIKKRGKSADVKAAFTAPMYACYATLTYTSNHCTHAWYFKTAANVSKLQTNVKHLSS